MKKLNWCLKQNKGIKLIKPNNNLSESYIKDADKTLENTKNIEGKWEIIMTYYACYNALYSVIIKAGIQSEIHDCTIELMNLFRFKKEQIEFMKELKEKRIKTQYYLEEIKLKSKKEVQEFILNCKIILDDLSSKKIERIREVIEAKLKK